MKFGDRTDTKCFMEGAVREKLGGSAGAYRDGRYGKHQNSVLPRNPKLDQRFKLSGLARYGGTLRGRRPFFFFRKRD